MSKALHRRALHRPRRRCDRAAGDPGAACAVSALPAMEGSRRERSI